MAEEFDPGWYLRKGASPSTPMTPMFFHAEASAIERRLIRDNKSSPDRR
jgi:hypothetical protein